MHHTWKVITPSEGVRGKICLATAFFPSINDFHLCSLVTLLNQR